MDYLDSILINPIEGVEGILAACPDIFRPHPFNNPDITLGKWSGYSVEECAELSKTDINLWLDYRLRLEEIEAHLRILRYAGSMDFIDNYGRTFRRKEFDGTKSQSMIRPSYERLYDLLDIQVVTALITDYTKDPIQAVEGWKEMDIMGVYKLLEERNGALDPANVANIRGSIYIHFYIGRIMYLSSNQMAKPIAETLKAKLEKIKSYSGVREFFKANELISYEVFCGDVCK